MTKDNISVLFSSTIIKKVPKDVWSIIFDYINVQQEKEEIKYFKTKQKEFDSIILNTLNKLQRNIEQLKWVSRKVDNVTNYINYTKQHPELTSDLCFYTRQLNSNIAEFQQLKEELHSFASDYFINVTTNEQDVDKKIYVLLDHYT